VNKSWCNQLNQHITSVNPHESRALISSDFRALFKFPYLTSLNIFALLDCSDNSEAKSLDAISKLTSLCQLELPFKTFGRLAGSFSSLTKLTSLSLAAFCFLGGDMRGLTPNLHILKLKCTCSLHDLLHIIPWFPSLRHLDVRVMSLKTSLPVDLRALAGLESLRVLLSRKISAKVFSGITSLVSLQGGSACITAADIALLPKFPQLRDLELILTDPKLLTHDSCTQVLAQLTSLQLDVDFVKPRPHFSGEFVNALRSLRSLSVRGFCFPEACVMDQLAGLTSLSLDKCFLSFNEEGFLASCRQLRSLSLTNMRGPWHAARVSLRHSAFPDLRGLTIQVLGNYPSWIWMIAKLTKLETLSIIFEGPVSPQHDEISQLEHLEHLESLGILGVHQFSGLNFPSYLEKWTQLESITLPVTRRTAETVCFFAEIRRLFPYLKVTCDISGVTGSTTLRF